MKKEIAGMLAALGIINTSCQKDPIEFGEGDIKIKVEAGEEWKHPFELLLGIKKKSSPQIAVWAEDMDGNYLSTIYVTHKAGTMSWVAAGGDTRKEALPYWNHKRLIINKSASSDAVTGATQLKPVPDASTGATPSGSFDIKLKPNKLTKFVIKAEFNHSRDYNDDFPKAAKENDPNYSGESGQPAVIYEAVINLDSDKKEFVAKLIGHSSLNGTDGGLYNDVSTLTTATKIVKEITIKVQN